MIHPVVWLPAKRLCAAVTHSLTCRFISGGHPRSARPAPGLGLRDLRDLRVSTASPAGYISRWAVLLHSIMAGDEEAWLLADITHVP